LSPDLLFYSRAPLPRQRPKGPFLFYLYFTLISCFFFSVRKDLNLDAHPVPICQ